MIDPLIFYTELLKNGISFYTGVPDSVNKSFCSCLCERIQGENHVIAANEGSAVALATGFFLATGNVPLVYFQNSGLGNALNPLTSLTNEDTFSIPMLLLIGWRGEKEDEPQHRLMGKVQNQILELINIPFKVLDKNIKNLSIEIKDAVDYTLKYKRPFAFVVKKGTMSSYQMEQRKETGFPSRKEVIKAILNNVTQNDIIISTTGMISREVFEYRMVNQQHTKNDFLVVGSMGHAAQVAVGVALHTDKKVFCLDGDGSALMHLGSFCTTGSLKPKNLIHIVFHNNTHDSVGGHPITNTNLIFKNIALSCGYCCAESTKTIRDLSKYIQKAIEKDGPFFIEIFTEERKDVSIARRPDTHPQENKINFMRFLGSL